MRGDLRGITVERCWGPTYLVMKRNEQANVKETKKENLERCQKNMISLKLIGKWIQAREN